MKKSLLALAVMGAFAGAAQAQQANNVTVYGIIDGGIRYQTNANAAGDKVWTEGQKTPTGVHIGSYNANRLGFKGVEDLGGGMNAHFVLENGFDSGTGGLDNSTSRLFNRNALVGLGGAWGTVDLGHQYSVSFKTIGLYDPFNYHHTGVIPLAGGVAAGNTGSITAANPVGSFGGTRFDNDVQYSGTFGPATVLAEYSFGEVAGGTSSNAAYAVGGNYKAGPITVGAAYTHKKPNVSLTTTSSYQGNSQWTVGGAFKMDAFRVAVGYANDRQDFAVGPNSRARNAWAGVSYDITPAFQLTGGWYQTRTDLSPTALGAAGATTFDGRKNLFIVGGTYALSKRTVVYTEVDYAKLRGISRVGGVPALTSATAPTRDNQTGVTVGLSHVF